ncbi:MAG: hypothetical protein J07AB43_04880 [Candidatus Nanosalina sp. J07AB43]|nr:MAG: hypothetical protein J07AB43_04880 [Candidatus Nanosalina sp. J07AB43]
MMPKTFRPFWKPPGTCSSRKSLLNQNGSKQTLKNEYYQLEVESMVLFNTMLTGNMSEDLVRSNHTNNKAKIFSIIYQPA